MSRTFIITFEINNLERRKAVKALIKSLYPRYCPIHKNAWAINSDDTIKAADVRDSLKVKLSPKDRVFVIRSGTAAAWSRPYSSEHSQWLKKYL